MMNKRKNMWIGMMMAFTMAALTACGSSGGEKPADGGSAKQTAGETAGGTTGEMTGEAAGSQTDKDAKSADPEKLSTKLYVGCSVRTFSNPYMVTIDEGCQLFCKYLDSIGQSYEYVSMLNEGSSDEQINQINAFLAKSGGNAILFCDPNEAAVCETIAEMVTEAGGYMCTTWNKPDEINVWDYDGWLAHTSPDDIEMGYQVAVSMFSKFETPYKGKIVAIQGLLGNTTAVNRYAGLEKALKEYPDVELVAEESANWSADTALTVMETWLAAHSDIDGVWCANDNMAIGAIKALNAKGLTGKVKVCGINAIEAALDAIAAGEMTCSIDCQGWQQGGYSLAYCYDAWLGNVDVPSQDHSMRLFGTSYTLVDEENVSAFKKAYYEDGVALEFEDYMKNFRSGDYPV